MPLGHVILSKVVPCPFLSCYRRTKNYLSQGQASQGNFKEMRQELWEMAYSTVYSYCRMCLTACTPKMSVQSAY